MKNVLLFLMVLGVIISCQPKQDPLPADYPNLLITRISFPGIPDKDITIDQPNRVIYVKMPALVTSTTFVPTVMLSEDAKLAAPGTLDYLSKYVKWTVNEEDVLKISLNGKTYPNQSATYVIKPEAKAPISITQSKALPVYAIGDSSYIYVDAQNLFGNALPKSAVFRNKRTGKQFILTEQKNTHFFSAHSFLNKLTIDVHLLELEPGEYEISLQLATGNFLEIPQSLTVIRGKSRISNPWFSTQAGKTITPTGANLFEGGVSFRLLYPNGSALPISATYTLNEKSVMLQIPNSLSPGYYGIELLDQGRPVGISHRLNVLRYENQPSIYALGGFNPRDYPTNNPMILPRTQNIFLISGGGEKIERRFFALINEVDPTAVFRFSLNYPLENGPYFSIPVEVPAGRYKAVIQEFDPITKEVMQQSEPFERIVVLQ